MMDEPQVTEQVPTDRYSDWYGMDTENDETGRVTLVALIHESGTRWVWKEAGHFIDWCDSASGKPVVICHNLEYDLVNEFGPKKYGDMQLNYLKGRLISARYKNVRFLDSFNHFRMSLKEIGRAIGIEKKDMDVYDEEYVCTDAWICLKAMTGARDYIASLCGQIGATSGSSAMSVWRYMTDDEFMTGPFDTPWMRKGYYGGRTEIFRKHTEGTMIRDGKRLTYRLGTDERVRTWTGSEADLRIKETSGHLIINREDSIRGYDINSMYPFCMMNPFPEYLIDGRTLDQSKGMAEVTISVPQSLFLAPLAWRGTSGELLYPVGVFRGTWTLDEIRTAERMGAKVLTVHRSVGCNAIVRPFDQFINTLYLRRKQSTSGSERLFLKVLMNSLYGKLVSRNTVTRTVSRYNLMKKDSPRIEEVKWITYHRGLLDYRTPQQPFVNVCWGAMVTAYSRLLLLQYMAQVPDEKLIYCDTDSIYCLDHELKVNNDIGGMKLERSAPVMTVVQPKAYRLGDQFKAKGVPKPKLTKDGKIEIDYARQYIEEGFTQFQAPIRFRRSLDTRLGVANQWIAHKKSMKTAYSSKTLSNGRYFPPVIAEQMELSIELTKRKKQTTQ